VVGKVGTAVVTQDELAAAALKAETLAPCRIMTLEEANHQAQIWRRKGYTVGFTNGCFDLLHLGHLFSLEECKKACDRLIVGLNTDSSIKKLKGESRPIQAEIVRAHVLAALEYVDAVILFEDDTPLRLIETLLPDMLFKGADYTIDRVVGADVVMLNGGKVHLIDLKPGYSTTATVEKLQKSG
jgi:D-beta-D-heptose 7-phosphate kinase/D-beta-D-heptose 1-phosphate adenosyltransferase